MAVDAIPSGARAVGDGFYSLSVALSLDDNGRLVLSGPDGEPLDPRVERRARKDKEPEFRAWLDEQCRSINDGDEEILALHLRTPSPDQQHRYNPERFRTLEPYPVPPLKLGLFDHLIPGRKRRRVLDHNNAVEMRGEETRQWKESKEAHEAKQEGHRHRYEELRLTDVPTMEELLNEALTVVPWPRETLISFDLNDDGRTLFLDVDLPEVEDMPTRSAEVAARGLKLNIKGRSDTQVRKLYMTHVHAVIFRGIGESFATLPSLNEVMCSGFSQRTDPATGTERDEYLLSVRVARDEWRRLNFNGLGQLDLVACLGEFDLRRDMSKSSVFDPIEPFAP